MKHLALLLTIIVGFSGISIAMPISILDTGNSCFSHPEPTALLMFGCSLICLAEFAKKIHKK